MRSRILIGLIAGTIGGFLGWILQENLINYNAHISSSVLPGHGQIVQSLTLSEVRTVMLCVGGLIGLFLGSVDGIVEGNVRKLWRGAVVGALAGFLLGLIGFQIGCYLYGMLGGNDMGARSPGMGAFAVQVIARTLGWAMMGLGLGVGSALSSGSPKRILHGAIGGFLGGFIGGFVFDLMVQSAAPVQNALSNRPGDVGGPGRATGFTAIGALTGFFIGLVDEFFKEAWVRVLAGKNEGKDYILSKAVSLLGRDERCDVPLYGDNSVAVQHAAIKTDGKRHLLVDAGSPAGTVVNGQKIQSGVDLLLRDGDMIQIASQRILFHEKATAKRVGRTQVDEPRSKPAGPAGTPIPAHLCPFCGGTKDAAGNCMCSVGSAPGMPVAVTGFSASQGGSSYDGAPYPGATAVAVAAGRMVGIEGATLGQVFILDRPNMELGREPGKDIVVTGDSTISRNHARIVNENGVFVVYDNGSSNGTLVNNRRISMQALSPGDIVQFGTSKFRFE